MIKENILVAMEESSLKSGRIIECLCVALKN